MLAVSKAGRKYGALKPKPDYRDYGLPQLRRTLVPSVDLEPRAGPVKDQGDLGACTAFAGTGMRELVYRLFTRYEKTPVNPVTKLQPVFSPMLLYYLERQIDGSLDQGDCGSTGRTCCKALNQFGVCLETEDVYAPANFETAPTPAQLKEALGFQSGAYHQLGTVMDMKSCLGSGYPFIIGFTVYESFESMAAPFVYNPDKQAESVLGGHEVLVLGYSDEQSAFKVRNSWGASWGNSGNFWMPYQVAADSDILIDAWMQHLGKAW